MWTLPEGVLWLNLAIQRLPEETKPDTGGNYRSFHVFDPKETAFVEVGAGTH
jgi:hypothetical protein